MTLCPFRKETITKQDNTGEIRNREQFLDCYGKDCFAFREKVSFGEYGGHTYDHVRVGCQLIGRDLRA